MYHEPSASPLQHSLQHSALSIQHCHLLTLDRVSLSFGHLPLFEDAEPPDRGGRAHLPHRSQRHGQVEPAQGDLGRGPAGRRIDLASAGAARVAPGSGRPGRRRIERCSTRWPPGWASSARSLRSTTTRRCRWRTTDQGLARLGELQHELEERDGWRLEQRVETVVSRLSLPADRSLGELSGGWRRRTLLGKALVSRAGSAPARRADEPSRHRRDPVARRLPARVLRRAAVRDARPRVPLGAGDAHRRSRSRDADVVARRLRQLSGKEGGGRRCGGPRARRGSTRSWRRRKRGCGRA